MITFRGQSVLGEVLLASRDGLSLVVRFAGTLGPYDQVMLLFWTEDGYRDILEGSHVKLLLLLKLPSHPYADSTRVWVHGRLSAWTKFIANDEGSIL